MARTFTLTPVPEQTQSTGTQPSYPSSSGFSLTPVVEDRSWGRAILDQGVSVAASVPRAAAGLASFAGMVPGVNYVADPLASGLNYIGDAISEHGLSDYQKNEDAEFATAIRESSMQLGPDAEWSDHLKNIASQGGAAASYLAKNPAQAVNVALETLPYLFGGGLAARAVNTGVKMASGGAKSLSAGTSGAIGEGIMAGGATTDQIVQEQRAEGIEGWTPERLYGGLAGLGTLGIGRIGNRIQGPADIDAMVAGGFKQAGNATNGPLKGALKGGLTEGAEELLQGAQEEAFVNQAMGRPLSEDVGSSAITGSIAGSGLGTLAGGYAGAINKLAESSATKYQTPFAPAMYPQPPIPQGPAPQSVQGPQMDPMQDPSVQADVGTDMGNGLDPSQDPSVIADQGPDDGLGYNDFIPTDDVPTTVDPNAPQEAVGGPVLSDMPEAVPGSEVAVDTPEGAPIEAGVEGPVEAPVNGPIEVGDDNPIVATVDGIDFVQDPDTQLLAPTDGAPVRYDAISDVWYDENGFEIPNPYTAYDGVLEAPADGPGLFDPNVDEVPVDEVPVDAEPVVAEPKPKKKGAVKKKAKAPKAPEINKEEPNSNEPTSPKEKLIVDTRENLKKELSDLVEKAKNQRDKDKKKGLDKPSPELNKIAKEISGRKKLLAESNLRAEKDVGDPEVKTPMVGRKGYDVKKVDATIRYGGKRSRTLRTNIKPKNLGAEILKRNDGVKGPDVYVQTNGPSGALIKWSPQEKKALDEALDTLLQYEGLGDSIPVRIFQRHPGKKKDSRWWNRGALNHSMNEDANFMALYIEDIVQSPSDKSVSNVIAHEIGVHGIMRITPDSENSKGEKIYDLFQKTWDENRDEIRRWLRTPEAGAYRNADMRTQVEEYFAFALESEIRDIANGKSQGYSQKVKRYLRQVQAYLDELLGKSHTIDQVAEMLVSAAERSIQKQGLPVSEIEMWNKSKGGLFTYYLNDDGKWKSEYPDSPKKVSRQVDEPTGVKYDQEISNKDQLKKIKLTPAETKFFKGILGNKTNISTTGGKAVSNYQGDAAELKDAAPSVEYSDGYIYISEADIDGLAKYIDEVVTLRESDRLPPRFYNDKFIKSVYLDDTVTKESAEEKDVPKKVQKTNRQKSINESAGLKETRGDNFDTAPRNTGKTNEKLTEANEAWRRRWQGKDWTFTQFVKNIATGKGDIVPQNFRNSVQDNFHKVNDALTEKYGIDATAFSISGLAGLKEIKLYLQMRYEMMGHMNVAQKMAERVYNTFEKHKEHHAEIMGYLLDDPKNSTSYKESDLISRGVPSNVVAEAKSLKKQIADNERALIQRGVLKKTSQETHGKSYLPQMYLKHVMEDGLGASQVGGARPSQQGYLKPRKDLDQGVKDLMGEIVDPGYLGASTVAAVGRDIAIIDFLNSIATKGVELGWVLPQSTVRIKLVNTDGDIDVEVVENGGRQVSVQWLMQEVQNLDSRIDKMPDGAPKENARRARDSFEKIASELDASLKVWMDQNPRKAKQYVRVPPTPRYGALAGMYVNKRIYNDLFGGTGPANNKYWNFAEKFHGYWKLAKVPLNPPTIARNIISNMVLQTLGGMPVHQMFRYNYKALEMIRTKDSRAWKIAEQYGLEMQTFSQQEMSAITREFKNRVKEGEGKENFLGLTMAVSKAMKGVEAAGSFYGKVETWQKLAVIQYHLDQGASDFDAFMEAQDTLFDYSLLNASAKKWRRVPIGSPFLSFTLLSAKRFGQLIAKHPTRMLYWWAVMEVLWTVFTPDGVDEEDMEDLHKALPSYLASKPTAFLLPLPGRDSEGRMTFMDVSYLHPFGALWDMVKGTSSGELDKLQDMFGMSGSPLIQFVMAFSTGVDPFTKKPITEEGYATGRKGWDYTKYVWRQLSPSFVNDQGAPWKIALAATGNNLSASKLKYGEPGITASQAIGRLIGINTYGVDPEMTAKANLMNMKYKMEDIKRVYKKLLRNPNYSEAKKQDIKIEMMLQIEALRVDMEVMKELAQVNPKLKVKDTKK